MRRLILILAILAAFLIFTPFAASQDILLLHSGDMVTVKISPGGKLMLLSLSDRSRVDVYLPGQPVQKAGFIRRSGWVTYPENLGGKTVTIKLREMGGGFGNADMPGDSDVVVRVISGTVTREIHTDTQKRGTRCTLCNVLLDW